MILVFVETDPAVGSNTGGATEVSRETVTFARTLAERAGGPLHAVIVGNRPDGVVDQLGAYGVTEVHHATGDGVAAGVVHLGDTVAAELVEDPVRPVADDHRVQRASRALGEGTRERHALPRHLGRAA